MIQMTCVKNQLAMMRALLKEREDILCRNPSGEHEAAQNIRDLRESQATLVPIIRNILNQHRRDISSEEATYVQFEYDCLMGRIQVPLRQPDRR